MPRYIDIEKIRIAIPSCVDENGDILVPLSDVRRALAQTPTADVAPIADTVRKMQEKILALSTYGTINISTWQLDQIAKEMLGDTL